MRYLLSVVIELREGMSVAGEAPNGVVAVTEAERLQPDVILLDLSMPDRTGLEALPDLNRVAPVAKVIILSGFAASIVEDDIHGSITAYLHKGCDPDEILAAIEDAVAVVAAYGPGRN